MEVKLILEQLENNGYLYKEERGEKFVDTKLRFKSFLRDNIDKLYSNISIEELLKENREFRDIQVSVYLKKEKKERIFSGGVKDFVVLGEESDFIIFKGEEPFAYIHIYEGFAFKNFGDWLIFSGHEEVVGLNLETGEINSFNTR